MDDQQLLRYSRHILLDEIGIEGQERLLASTALIVGLGGLGSPAALYLAASGVGRLILVDHDNVDLTNLQRQIAHTRERVGQSKVTSAQVAVQAINDGTEVECHPLQADEALLDQLVPRADVVLDCTDHFAVRQRINASCVRHRVPLVEGAAIRFEGQVASFDLRLPDAPCYACLFPPGQQVAEVACATMGVYAPLVGMIGTMQAAHALALLLGRGDEVQGQLLRIDARRMQLSTLRLARDPHCPICGSVH